MNNLQIMLAEDSTLDAFLVEQALKYHHIACELHGFKDGLLALRYLEHVAGKLVPCPDLVLLDLHLPAVDGPEVLTALRKHPICSRVPVIVITSSDAPKDKAIVAALGISHYFEKPKDLNAFMELGRVVIDVMDAENANAFRTRAGYLNWPRTMFAVCSAVLVSYCSMNWATVTVTDSSGKRQSLAI